MAQVTTAAGARSGTGWDLYDDHVAQVRRIVRARVRDQHEAEDIIQEVFLRVHRAVDALDDRPAGPWIRTIAVNTTTEHLRRKLRRPIESGFSDHVEPSVSSESDPGDRLLARARREAVVEVLNALPPRQRRLLALAAIDEVALDALAEQEDLSSNAVKQVIKRARGTARAQLRTIAGDRGLLGLPPVIGLLPGRIRSGISRIWWRANVSSSNARFQLSAAPQLFEAAALATVAAVAILAPISATVEASTAAAQPIPVVTAPAALAPGGVRTATGGVDGYSPASLPALPTGAAASGPATGVEVDVHAAPGTGVKAGTVVHDREDSVKLIAPIEGRVPDGLVEAAPGLSTTCGNAVRQALCDTLRAMSEP